MGDAHAVSVVHRDIKPANVLLRERGREIRCGWTRWHTPGDRFRVARVYAGGNNWSVNVNARSKDKRFRGLELVGAYRAPNRLRGVPL